jgi:hypothetical protein
MRKPRLCECGQPVTTVNGRFCDGCRRERNSHGGRPKGSGNREADHYGGYQALSNKPIIRVKAKCPKCQITHYIKLRRDPGRMLFEYCGRHAHLRYEEHQPTMSLVS